MLDPFMGSGSVGLAALMLKRQFLGNDLCDEAVRVSKARLFDHIAANGNGTQSPSKPAEVRLSRRRKGE